MFDAHFHIIDPQYPLVENEGYVPASFAVRAYRKATVDLDVSGGAVVSGSFQGFDQGYLVAALAALGEGFVGVTQLPSDVADEEVLRLHEHGVRAVRFNLKRGGSAPVDAIDTLARRVHELCGWHTELYVDAAKLPELEPRLRGLPRVGIDHLGLTERGLPHLLRFVEHGGFVKATGFGRLDFDPATALAALVAANPAAVVFGTDLPSTRANRPFAPSDIDLVRETVGDSIATRVLSTNAIEIYLH